MNFQNTREKSIKKEIIRIKELGLSGEETLEIACDLVDNLLSLYEKEEVAKIREIENMIRKKQEKK